MVCFDRWYHILWCINHKIFGTRFYSRFKSTKIDGDSKKKEVPLVFTLVYPLPFNLKDDSLNKPQKIRRTRVRIYFTVFIVKLCRSQWLCYHKLRKLTSHSFVIFILVSVAFNFFTKRLKNNPRRDDSSFESFRN